MVNLTGKCLEYKTASRVPWDREEEISRLRVGGAVRSVSQVSHI